MEFLGQDRREGLGRKSESRVSLLLLILVSLFLLLSSLYAAEASVFKKAREATLEVAAPILSIFAGPAAFIQDRIGDVQDYFNVLEQNKALREQVASLRQWENEARQAREIIASYQALDDFAASPVISQVSAFVVGESNEAFLHTMIVNAGRNKNVEPGQAVISENGLVGRIVDASSSAARVLLLNDVQSRVPVYVDGDFVEGILAGNSGGRPTILFTNTDDLETVTPGALVYSSGAGGVMPRGIPVGTVAAFSEDGVLVDLKVNYARTRVVRVIKFEFPTEVEEEEPERPLSPSERAAIEANPLLSATAEAPAPPAEIENDGD